MSVCLVTDIGGLNDRGFNHLAYVGLQEAKSKLHVTTNVLQSKSGNDYLLTVQTGIQMQKVSVHVEQCTFQQIQVQF